MTNPGYWMYETSGVLRPVVERYLRGDDLSSSDIAVLRGYLRQWINAPAWDANPHGTKGLTTLRDMINLLTTRKQIELWSARALDEGLDPW